MFKKFSTLLALALITTSAYAKGGVEGGNGGIGVVCRNANNTIKSVKLLDLDEAERIHGWVDKDEKVLNDAFKTKERAMIMAFLIETNLFREYVSPNHVWIFADLLAKQLRTFTGKDPIMLDPDAFAFRMNDKRYSILEYLDKQLLREATPPKSRVKVIGADEELNPTFDYTVAVTLPKGCKYEQIATYTATNELYINPELFNAMTLVHQAALYLHEAIWATHRKVGLTNSDLARRLVGVTFGYLEKIYAGEKNQDVLDSFIKQITIMSHLTLKLYYDYDHTGTTSYHLLHLNPEQRGSIQFDYKFSGDTKNVKCVSATKWHSWLNDETLETYKYDWVEELDFIRNVNGVYTTTLDTEYLGLRNTSIEPKITCSLIAPNQSAKIKVSFVLFKGKENLVTADLGTVELNAKNPKIDFEYKPILFQ